MRRWSAARAFTQDTVCPAVESGNAVLVERMKAPMNIGSLPGRKRVTEFRRGTVPRKQAAENAQGAVMPGGKPFASAQMGGRRRTFPPDAV